MSPLPTQGRPANWERCRRRTSDNNAPAGAINSCVADLAKWVTLQLNRGEWETRGSSAPRSPEMWSAQTIIRIGAPAGLCHSAPTSSAYGLGWYSATTAARRSCLTRAAFRDTFRV